jgi:glutamyl-tRNA reductase
MNRRMTLHHGVSRAAHVHITNGRGGRHQPRVSVLGTGKMGSTILAAAGFELTVWNRARQRAEELGIGRVAGSR